MGGEARSLIDSGESDCHTKAVLSKPRKKTPTKKGKTSNGVLTPEVAEELLRQHCRGMWSDSDEDASGNTKPGRGGVEADNEEEPRQDESESCSSNIRFLPSGHPSKKQKKRRNLGSDGASNPELEPSVASSCYDRGKKMQEQNQHESVTLAAEMEETFRRHQLRQQRLQGETAQSKRQAKGLRKWSSMQPRASRSGAAAPSPPSGETTADPGYTPQEARRTSRSLQLLKELGGLASTSPVTEGHSGASDQRGKRRTNGHEQELKETRDARKVFDETVNQIRNMVYPHLGRFQRRQFVTTALRALGISSAKTQKMPLPELQSRKKATAAALKARREEAKALGVSSHIDAQGSVQQAARNRSKLASQKQRRKHLRDTFKHAGKYSDKRMRSGGGKK